MAIPSIHSDRDRVLDAIDLVALIREHVQLKPKGREHVGLCPFHDDRTPSMHVVTHKGSGFYKCFACGAAGNAIDFMMNYHKMEFIEALKALAERAGIDLQQARPHDDTPGSARADLLRANAIALEFYRRALAHAEHGQHSRAALEARQISAAMQERFQLGAAPPGWDTFVRYLERLREHRRTGSSASAGSDRTRVEGMPPMEAFRAAGLVREGRDGLVDGFRNRLIFPICDELGKPIAFGARQLNPEDQPKYLNSPESSVFHKGKGLYGLHLAKKAIIAQRTAIICEGYTDVIACHEAGVENAVATLGTALTRDHARVLQRMCERVVLLFDGDAAGQRAADRAVEVFFAEPVDVRICTLPDELDPDELLRMEGGAERFRTALEASEDALRYLVRRFHADYRTASGLSGRQQRIEALLQKLVELGFRTMPGIRRQLVLASLAQITGLSEAELEKALAALRGPQPRPRTEDEAPADAVDASTPETTLEERGYSVPKAKARREAEQSVLALLLAYPHVAQGRLSLGDDCTLPVAEAITPEAFEDPPHRALMEVIHPWLENRHEFSAPELLAEVHSPTLKALASDLLLLGSRRAPEGKGASQRLAQAFADLEGIRRSQQPVSPSPASSGVESLLAVIQNRQAAGHQPTAFRPKVRQSPNQRSGPIV
ncbi:MAG: DNA primase [Phycisphaerales bacterium]